MPDDIAEEVRPFFEVGNVFDDAANAYLNYKYAEAVLDTSGAMWGWSTVWAKDSKNLFAYLRERGMVSRERYLGVDFDRKDEVDKPGLSQPGPKSQVWFAGIIWDWLHARYGSRIQTLVDRYKTDHPGEIA
jgi:hypothetical protein